MAWSYSSKSLRKKFHPEGGIHGFFQPKTGYLEKQLLSISINLKPLRSSNPVAFKDLFSYVFQVQTDFSLA